MAKQTINLGTAPSGAGGDTSRSALTKTQANIDELYVALGGSTLPAALPVVNGGTGATTAAAARIALGLATPALDAVPIANGGTGATTVAAALASLGITGAYTKANILGTVSQVSGVPTGSAFQFVSNANGMAIKYADGTMECWSTTAYNSSSISSQSGAIFFGAPAAPQSFPVAFTSVPTVSQNFEGAAVVCWAAPNGLSTNAAWGGVYPFSDTTRGATTLYLHRYAIGRWY